MTASESILRWPLFARRAVAIGVLGVVIALGAFAIVLPLTWLFSGDSWRESMRAALGEDRAWAAAADHVHERLGALAGSADWQQFYGAQTPEEGAALLLTDLRAALGRGGVSANSAIPMKGDPISTLTEVGGRVVAVMVATQLEQVLREIANHSRYLEIRRLSVTAPPFQAEKENPELMVTLEVIAFLDPRNPRAAR